jgi:lipid-binding SYLF domain-containing protein
MRRTLRDRGIVVVGLVAGALALGVAAPCPVRADDAADARQLVEKARHTVETFSASPVMNAFRDAVKRAKGVFVAPQVLRGAFILGASGGTGVLVARNEAGQWSGPAFYSFGEASFGLQIGGDASEVILLAMTDRGVTKLLSATGKLGVDASVAAGPVGAGATVESAGLSADIISFSLSKGLYGGMSVEGAVVGVRESLNKAFYGKEVTPTDILIRRTVAPAPPATELIATLVKVAGGK